MFKNDRYVTSGIRHQIPMEQQLMIWTIIDDFLLKGIEVDYLQVVTLSLAVDKIGVKRQLIKHTQEEREYCQYYWFKVDEVVSEKIFIIDDGLHTTMMLASEY